MSSNIQIQRVCEFCGNEFTARTTVTKLCSAKCRKASYKARQRTEKIEKSNSETKRIKSKPIEELKEKEFLSVREVATLLGCSIRTAYRLIDTGILQGVNLAERLTRIKRSELNKLLEQPRPQKPQLIQYDISECYSLSEIQNKYGISDKALYNAIKRNEIPELKQGWYTYVPKVLIDKILT
jgi:excisionase family DNA binding protein